ncbi:MAG: hypothetical protein ABI851_02095 [Saprospiraceae bacterium]
MKFFLILLTYVSLIFGCHNQVNYKYENYYEIIDDFIRFYYYDSDVAILNELTEVNKYPNDNFEISIDEIQLLEPPPLPPQPPPPGRVYVSKLYLKMLNKNHLIDTNDIQYFYDQFSYLEKYTLNPLRVNKTNVYRFNF